MDYQNSAKVFKAFCDETRLRILELLQDGEKCTCVINGELDVPQSTLSYHMKILCESSIVTGRQEGKWTHYRISGDGMVRAMEILKELSILRAKLHMNTECCV